MLISSQHGYLEQSQLSLPSKFSTRFLTYFGFSEKQEGLEHWSDMQLLVMMWILVLSQSVYGVKKPDYKVIAKIAARKDPKHIVMNDGYRIHEELGMALTPGKLLASSQRSIYQSIFLKLEKPSAPDKPCSFNCYPDDEKMDSHLEAASTCWIGRQVFPSLTVIKIIHSESHKDCVIRCLADSNQMSRRQ